jgi:thiol:disulfide interchange protein DsbC
MHIRTLAFSLLITVASHAVAEKVPDFRGSPLEGADIQAMENMPIRGLKAVQANGRLMFMSDTGRFVFVGDVYDTWSFKKLTSMEEIRDAANRVNLANFNLNIKDELKPYVIGSGKKEVVVFVDPLCPHCHSLLKDLENPPDGYSFLVVTIPALGKDSGAKVRQLGCATDREQAKKALITGDYSNLQQDPNCDLLPVQKALVTAQVLGVQGVPFLVAPDGRVNRGRPQDLAAFLGVK